MRNFRQKKGFRDHDVERGNGMAGGVRARGHRASVSAGIAV
jgi:hypothetical protein